MTKEKLKKEAENWLRKYLLCCNCEKKCNCIDSNSYCEEQVLKAYVDSAEPREKQIEELKAQTKVLEQNLEDTEICENGLKNRIVDLEAQIEKVKHYLDYDIPHDLINEATTKIWRMLK